MDTSYVVTNEYLAEKGLDLNEYALEGTFINAIIQRALDILVDRICEIGDEFKSEDEIEEFLEEDDDYRTAEQKQSAFLKAQYVVIYNLVFQNETSPVDRSLDSILVHQLGCKINSFQKGLYYKNN